MNEAPQQKAPQQKRIDIPSGIVTAGGFEFFIQYSLSTTRFVEYLKKLPKLTFNTTFPGMYDTLSKIYMVSSSGNDMIYSIGQCRELSWNQLEAIKRFDENEIIDVVDFCALFLNRSGEDVSKFNEPLHLEKARILQEEGYDTSDFFLLAGNCIEKFPEAYQKILSLLNQGEQLDIRLNSNTPQTSSTS